MGVIQARHRRVAFKVDHFSGVIVVLHDLGHRAHLQKFTL